MPRIQLVIVVCGALLAVLVPSQAKAALPHGCASVTSDYSIATDPSARRVAVKVNTNEPCTFRYAPGDTFSGSGRFTVTCSTGGYYHHPDFQDGQYPPVFGVEVPQPCAVGATVTLNGYLTGSGGAVIGGGPGVAPDSPEPWLAEADFTSLCAPGSDAYASVELLPPVDYSGFLTYRGRVRCDGANVVIESVRIRALGDDASPSAGSAHCAGCASEVSVSGSEGARAWAYEVDLRFEVTNGTTTVADRRIGRYLVGWAGNVSPLCPTVGDPAFAVVQPPGVHTCPA